jgi:PBP1b-binding outer membrane lipoprotein LpoB
MHRQIIKLSASIAALACFLGGCSSSSSAVDVTTASEAATVSIPADAETADCVVEQDYALTMNVTIQDLTVMFIKADDYDSSVSFEAGDEIAATYSGDLSGNPTLYLAVKK